MNFFNGIPFISFLILSVLLAGRIFVLQKKGVQVSPKKGESNHCLGYYQHPFFYSERRKNMDVQ